MTSYLELKRKGGDLAVSAYRERSKLERDAKWKKAEKLRHKNTTTQNKFYTVHI